MKDQWLFTKYVTFFLFLFPVFVADAQSDIHKKLNVGVFVYNGMEILDFAGPAEVFSVASTKDGDNWYRSFNVFTVAISKEAIISQGYIKVVPEYTINNCPDPDIIIFPGGSTGEIRGNKDVINWIERNSKENEILLSVCTGAFILADAGLLDGKKVTTWYGQIENLRSSYKETEVLEKVRFVDNDNIITTAGVSAGIDGSLHLVERLLGKEAAEKVAKYMEYDKWNPKDGLIISNK